MQKYAGLPGVVGEERFAQLAVSSEASCGRYAIRSMLELFEIVQAF